MSLTTSHISVEENTLADTESRKSRKETKWTLDRGMFHEAIKKVVSLRLTYSPLGLIPSKGHLWPTNQILSQWLLMPFQFLGNLTFFMLSFLLGSFQKCYRKSKQRRPQCAMVVPCWPTQPWWPLVMRLLVQEPLVRCVLKEIENMYSVFLSSCRNTRESLGELEKAVETQACSSCFHSICRSPKLPLMFLLNNYIMSSRFLSRDS